MPVGKRSTPDQDAMLCVYLLHCPGDHAIWNFWWLALIHLRPIEGVRAPTIVTPGAGYEVICFAQHPDFEPDPDNLEDSMHVLDPLDWVVQFGDVTSDSQAQAVALAAVHQIIMGRASPDSDFREYWKQTIPATARCYATGRHGPS